MTRAERLLLLKAAHRAAKFQASLAARTPQATSEARDQRLWRMAARRAADDAAKRATKAMPGSVRAEYEARSAASRERWRDHEYRAKMSAVTIATNAKRWKDPSERAKQSLVAKRVNKKRWRDPINRAKQRAVAIRTNTERWKDPNARAEYRAAMAKHNISASMRNSPKWQAYLQRLREDPIVRAKSPTYRANMSASLRNSAKFKAYNERRRAGKKHSGESSNETKHAVSTESIPSANDRSSTSMSDVAIERTNDGTLFDDAATDDRATRAGDHEPAIHEARVGHASHAGVDPAGLGRRAGPDVCVGPDV